MPKHYKEMMDEIINKMPVEESNLRYSVKFAYQKGGKIANAFYKDKSDAEKFVKSVIAKGGKAILPPEAAPANAVAHGGVDMAPNAKHPLSKSHMKYKKDNEKNRPDPLMFAKPIKRKIKESDDNNNVVLRGVIDKIENIEHRLDEKILGKTEFKIEEEKEYKTFKDKYNA